MKNLKDISVDTMNIFVFVLLGVCYIVSVIGLALMG